MATISDNVQSLVERVAEASSPCSEVTTGTCTNCQQCSVRNPAAVEAIVRSGASRIGAGLGIARPAAELAKLIDHTLLKPDASREQIVRLCEEAVQYGFASVCVNPCWVKLCASAVRGSGVLVCSVVGFPLGANVMRVKAMEAARAVQDGADEIDMVMNIGMLKSGEHRYVEEDIRGVVRAAAPAHVKVIIEACLLTDREKIYACLLAQRAGAHFVKTSTGFSTGGATAADVALMRRVVGSSMGVKAAGGIRDLEAAQAMVAAGANRIGASASVSIVSGQQPTS
ncbi:MAG: deoxyribose-phosphate aldolase [Calditrichaeota bacterium]|nr:deoxyribose-phosphate aldolase [Calditrichota bacterium]